MWMLCSDFATRRRTRHCGIAGSWRTAPYLVDGARAFAAGARRGRHDHGRGSGAADKNRVMAIKRIKPNILSDRFDESRAFYNDVIGLEGGDGLDWILFFGTDKREVQLSVMKLDITAHVHPDVSIEVDDVDEVYERALAAGAEIVYPITDEDWGLRRFFVRDPNGAVINVTKHR
jgi:catechol 2,3-dioxygenase-like lactoylglutathione lyase family enzyme